MHGEPFTGILFSHTTFKPAVYINNGKPVSRELFYGYMKLQREAKAKRAKRIKRLRKLSLKLAANAVCDDCATKSERDDI